MNVWCFDWQDSGLEVCVLVILCPFPSPLSVAPGANPVCYQLLVPFECIGCRFNMLQESL